MTSEPVPYGPPTVARRRARCEICHLAVNPGERIRTRINGQPGRLLHIIHATCQPTD